MVMTQNFTQTYKCLNSKIYLISKNIFNKSTEIQTMMKIIVSQTQNTL